MIRVAMMLFVLLSACLVRAQPALPSNMEPVAPPSRIPQVTNPKKPYPVMVGDPAPPLDIKEWILGDPITSFEPGRVYLIMIWSVQLERATSIMPRLTDLQNQYADKGLTVIGATSPGRINTREAVEDFVFRGQTRVGFHIAWDRTRVTLDSWLNAAGRTGIPCIFIVDQEGLIAFIGGIAEFERPLIDIIEKRHNIDLLSREYYDCISASWALQHMEQKMRDQDWPGAYNLGREIINTRGQNCHGVLSNIAWMLVDPENAPEVTDYNLALLAARRADELSDGKDADTIDTLARVYFLMGEKEKAIELQERAVQMARSAALKEPLQRTLDEYRAALGKR